ncbi:hypothetical protein [Halorhabdus salina]|uniref:hypothetical protein n=1 Tax=Halorhabdus salina TaxID=2750670 RepID=UPI0015EEFF42|nr:hypothetical protein [Halorhabdus salina]
MTDRTPTEAEVYSFMQANPIILSPSIIAENIGRSRGAVQNALSTLRARGEVNKLDRGKYRARPGVIDE